MIANPILDAARGRHLLSNIPASVACILFTLVAAALGVLYGDFPAPKSPPSAAPPAQVETHIATEGEDRNHRHLPFTVYVLAEQLSWKLESTNDLEGGSTLLSPALLVALNGAPEVFCVGTASFEGATPAEEARADQRANRLAQWVKAAVDRAHTRIFTLNAGQYRGQEELESARQRKAVILITGPHDDEVDLGEALRSGLEQIRKTSPVVDNLLSHYSRSRQWLKGLSEAGHGTPRRRHSIATPAAAAKHPHRGRTRSGF
jgi:hypothetical protein